MNAANRAERGNAMALDEELVEMLETLHPSAA